MNTEGGGASPFIGALTMNPAVRHLIERVRPARFVCGAIAVLALLHLVRHLVLVQGVPGVRMFAGFAGPAVIILLFALVAKRRQTGIWAGALQIAAALLGANTLVYVLLAPLLPPEHHPVSVVPAVVAMGLIPGLRTLYEVSALIIPPLAGLLWLARRAEDALGRGPAPAPLAGGTEDETARPLA